VADRIKGDTAGAIADYTKVIELADTTPACTAAFPERLHAGSQRGCRHQEFYRTVNGGRTAGRAGGSYLAAACTEFDLLDQADRAEGRRPAPTTATPATSSANELPHRRQTDTAKDFFQKCGDRTGDCSAFKFARRKWRGCRRRRRRARLVRYNSGSETCWLRPIHSSIVGDPGPRSRDHRGSEGKVEAPAPTPA